MKHVKIPKVSQKATRVIGPLGEALAEHDLPPADTTRWVIRRKAEVVAAVNGGLLTTDEACERYNLSLEELISWQEAVHRSGMTGLRITRLQEYRAQKQKQDA
ncbi:DUF1153 domain-containing protein [Parasphingorhabdus sp. JC815]|uniref:CtrA inhibitor SciP n=1 Tax=Parasphingorhabdus sp. JC815 TaxID=3232140 RepID=UPI00345773A5